MFLSSENRNFLVQHIPIISFFIYNIKWVIKMNLLPERLRELRDRLHRTQQQVADDLNISRKLLSNYECGTREPSIDMLQTLATYYFVSIDYIVGASAIENPYKQYPGVISNLMNDSNYLSNESIKDLEKYVALLKLRDDAEQQKK